MRCDWNIWWIFKFLKNLYSKTHTYIAINTPQHTPHYSLPSRHFANSSEILHLSVFRCPFIASLMSWTGAKQLFSWSFWLPGKQEVTVTEPDLVTKTHHHVFVSLLFHWEALGSSIPPCTGTHERRFQNCFRKWLAWWDECVLGKGAAFWGRSMAVCFYCSKFLNI